MSTWNDMPLAECPHCGAQWQADDWYDLDVDDTINCPKCDKDIIIVAKECTMMLEFDKPEPKERKK